MTMKNLKEKKSGYALEVRLVRWKKDHRSGIKMGRGKHSRLVTSENVLAESWVGSFAVNKASAVFRYEGVVRSLGEALERFPS